MRWLDRILPRSSSETDQDVAELEIYLQSSLYPVQPRPVFINTLKKQLLTKPLDGICFDNQESADMLNYFLLAVAGVVSGMVLVAAGARAVLTVLATFGILRNIKVQNRQKRSVSFPVS